MFPTLLRGANMGLSHLLRNSCHSSSSNQPRSRKKRRRDTRRRLFAESLERRIVLTCGVHSLSVGSIDPVDEAGSGFDVDVTITGDCGAELNVEILDQNGNSVDMWTESGLEGMQTIFAAPPMDDDPSADPANTYSMAFTLVDMAYDVLATASTTFEVRNVAPTIDSLQASVSDPAMYTVDLSASFSDPSMNDTFDITIDWGDGASESSGAS